MAIHVTPIPITSMTHTALTDVTTAQHHTKYTGAEAIAAVEGEPSLVLSGTVAGLTLAGAADANSQAINNIGSSGIDITSTGLLESGVAMVLSARNSTNTGVSHVGNAVDVSVGNGQTMTFNMANAIMFFLQIGTTGAGAAFFCCYNNATMTAMADPSASFDVTDVNNGKIAVFKSSSSETVSVKNYTGGTKTLSAICLGDVAAATAPA